MVKKLLMKTRIAILFIILMLVEVILLSGFSFNSRIELTKEILGNQAYKAAYTVSQFIDGDKLEEVISMKDENHPYYIELQKRLSEARRTLGLEYLYTMTKDNAGRYIYVVDGMDRDSKDFSNIGDVEDYEAYFRNFELALKGQAIKDDLEFNNKWGNLVSAYIPIKNSKGSVVAFLGADLEASPVLEIMNKSSIATVFITIIITLLGIIGVLVLSRRAAYPVTKLRDFSRGAENGAFASFTHDGHSDEVGEITAVIENRMEAVKTILDNTGQGFLTFGEDMLVDSEYSVECSRIFGGEIENRDFLGLIHPEDLEKRKFIGAVLIRLIKEQDPARRTIYFPLLSEELLINGQRISVDYRIITSKSGKDQRFMVILTDITEKRALENKIENERNVFKMVIKVAVNYDDFMLCTRDYSNYFNEAVPEILSSDISAEEKRNEVFRHIHTLKGSFSQLGMDNTASGLHSLESELSELSGETDDRSADDLRRLMASFQYNDCIEKDMGLLKDILGEDFMNRFAGMEKGLVIDRAKLLDIEKKMLSILSPIECRLLLPDIQKLRYRPMRELLKSYPDYVVSLAERLGKQVNEPVISGGEFQVDIEKYSSFAKSLTHAFRNALDHGIESPEDRLEAGKSGSGNIYCVLDAAEDNMQIKISDDGYGINIERIKQKAVEKGIYSKAQIEQLSEDQVLNIIFEEGFSTKEKISETSGRGMGLPSVLKEVERLKGSISVSSKAGGGTEFTITLPLYKIPELVKLSINDIMTPLMDKTIGLVKSLLCGAGNSSDSMNAEKNDRMVLKEYTAFTDIKGVIEGRLALSFDGELARQFASDFSVDGLPEGDDTELIEDSISECLNIILGNSIKLFPGLEELVLYNSPVTISSEGTIIKYPESDVWTRSIKFDCGSMSLNLAVPRGMLQ